MKNKTPLYLFSRKDAYRLGEINKWTESYQANCDCARAIEKAIADGYSDNRLDDVKSAEIVSEYGFDRTNWILATTIQSSASDGRYSQGNKDWANKTYIPKEIHNLQNGYTVNAHPGLVDVFTNQVRKLWDDMGFFNKSHCFVDETDYTGKVVVINPKALSEEYKTPEYQLFYASNGNGCRPNSLGVKVFGQCLKDGEKDYFARSDIVGVITPDNMPGWAKERYAEIIGNDGATEDVTMGEPK